MPMISLTAADGFRLQAYRTGPQDAARALVVTQEIFGVNRHIRKLCDDFAAAGYAVIAPQLFDRAERNVELGYDAADLARGRELRGKIDAGKTVLDVLAAAAALPRQAKR
ncbi:MAG: dienelactone hydrolase family protein, partial [Alphaproteobacteria bacterium]